MPDNFPLNSIGERPARQMEFELIEMQQPIEANQERRAKEAVLRRYYSNSASD